MILDRQLPVALERHIGEAALAACPLRSDIHLLQVNLLGIVVPGKNIIEAQGAALEEIVKLLRCGGCCRKRNAEDNKKSFFHLERRFIGAKIVKKPKIL